MRRRTNFPAAVRHIENLFIPLPDGTRLAARAWIPERAESEPVPAIVEYIPYRKRDNKRARDQSIHAYFAGHGYACLRVDMRGSGESDGVLLDEYLPQEQEDGLALLEWIAAQPWCNGRTGLMGLSWGGFNALQIAALRPPSLGAVISLCSTDDRYADDVHYMGGCLLGDNLSWASVMFAKNACPPDPELVGDRWRSMWKQRLEANRPWLLDWLSHQHRDAYWRHGSVCEEYGDIACPVMAVSGWADGYSNAVFRLMERLRVPRLGLIGAWSHRYPHEGTPGPAIGFLQEAVRWWDRWLRDAENGVEHEPMLRVWMQDSAEPDTTPQFRTGSWVGEPRWPSANIENRVYTFTMGRLVEGEPEHEGRARTIQSPLSIGLFAGKWCSYGTGPDMPYDQREEDGGALLFTSPPVGSDLEILGSPEVVLTLCASRPTGMIAVRLEDVAPDDKATRVTFGLLNLTHRESHAEPTPMTPGRRYRVRVRLNGIAHRVKAGTRVRVALSTSYWPMAWPPPTPTRLEITEGLSRLVLPVRTTAGEAGLVRPFEAPEAAEPPPREQLTAPEMNWRVIRDLSSDESVLEVTNDQGEIRHADIGLRTVARAREWYRSVGNDFASPRGEVVWTHGFQRGAWRVRTESRTVLTCDPEFFHLHATLDAYEGEYRVFDRSWSASVPRDLV